MTKFSKVYTSHPTVITSHKHRVEGWSYSTESVHNHSEVEGGTQSIHTFTHSVQEVGRIGVIYIVN